MALLCSRELTACLSPREQKYPIVWQGLLALKNDTAAVQLHFVSGNNVLAHRSLPLSEGGPPLRIAQRMRLEASQLEGVARRMTVSFGAQARDCPAHDGGRGLPRTFCGRRGCKMPLGSETVFFSQQIGWTLRSGAGGGSFVDSAAEPLVGQASTRGRCPEGRPRMTDSCAAATGGDRLLSAAGSALRP